MNDFSKPGSVIWVEDNTLTLRDRFAIAAMNGLMSDNNTISVCMRSVTENSLEDTAAGFAQICYTMADCMLKVRGN